MSRLASLFCLAVILIHPIVEGGSPASSPAASSAAAAPAAAEAEASEPEPAQSQVADAG